MALIALKHLLIFAEQIKCLRAYCLHYYLCRPFPLSSFWLSHAPVFVGLRHFFTVNPASSLREPTLYIFVPWISGEVNSSGHRAQGQIEATSVKVLCSLLSSHFRRLASRSLRLPALLTLRFQGVTHRSPLFDRIRLQLNFWNFHRLGLSKYFISCLIWTYWILYNHTFCYYLHM